MERNMRFLRKRLKNKVAMANTFTKQQRYRVTLVVEYLGWVDLNLECSTILLGQYVTTVAANQPGELSKSKSTQPRYLTTRVTL